MRLDVTFDSAQFEARTAEMAARLADFTPYWETVASPMIAGWFTSIWETEGAIINGSRWAPLTETTLGFKAARGREKMGTLRDSDRLYQSLTVRGDADQLRDVSPSALFYGTAANAAGAPYPAFLQHGWTMHNVYRTQIEPPRDVPARPFVPVDHLPDPWAQALRSTMLDYIQHGLS